MFLLHPWDLHLSPASALGGGRERTTAKGALSTLLCILKKNLFVRRCCILALETRSEDTIVKVGGFNWLIPPCIEFLTAIEV